MPTRNKISDIINFEYLPVDYRVNPDEAFKLKSYGQTVGRVSIEELSLFANNIEDLIHEAITQDWDS